MNAIKNIICPVDFSEGSARAVAYALVLARSVEAELHIVHSYQLPLYALPDGGLVAGPEYVQQVSNSSQTSLDTLVEGLDKGDLVVKTHLTEGVPHVEIARLTAELEGDLVVMGTHGRTGLKHILMGSVAERVVRTSEKPVLTIRQREDDQGAPWGGQITRLLVAFDFSDPARRALEEARRLRAQLHCAVDVVFVLDDPFTEHPGAPKESVWAAEKELEAHEAALKTVIGRTVTDVFGPDAQTVTTSIARGGAVQSILSATEQSGADIIIVATTGKGGVERMLMGSVSQKLLQTSTVPVITIH